MSTGFAAQAPVAIRFTLKDETLAQASGQLGQGSLAIVGIVALIFAGQQYMQGVVAVVVPLPVEVLLQQARLVVFILQDQPHVSVGRDGMTHTLAEYP
ncbi:hypothetical protein D3C77_536170 [compost metagenome]